MASATYLGDEIARHEVGGGEAQEHFQEWVQEDANELEEEEIRKAEMKAICKLSLMVSWSISDKQYTVGKV